MGSGQIISANHILKNLVRQLVKFLLTAVYNGAHFGGLFQQKFQAELAQIVAPVGGELVYQVFGAAIVDGVATSQVGLYLVYFSQAIL